MEEIKSGKINKLNGNWGRNNNNNNNYSWRCLFTKRSISKLIELNTIFINYSVLKQLIYRIVLCFVVCMNLLGFSVWENWIVWGFIWLIFLYYFQDFIGKFWGWIFTDLRLIGGLLRRLQMWEMNTYV
jgi:hypothetical protein